MPDDHFVILFCPHCQWSPPLERSQSRYVHYFWVVNKLAKLRIPIAPSTKLYGSLQLSINGGGFSSEQCFPCCKASCSSRWGGGGGGSIEHSLKILHSLSRHYLMLLGGILEGRRAWSYEVIWLFPGQNGTEIPGYNMCVTTNTGIKLCFHT